MYLYFSFSLFLTYYIFVIFPVSMCRFILLFLMYHHGFNRVDRSVS